MFRFAIVYLCFILFATCAWGISDRILSHGCRLTPQIWGLEAPPITEKNNDLRYQTGFPDRIPGEQIMITGYVMDEYCVPVSNASINIWQIKTMAEKDALYLTGSTSTDSTGKFSFFSVVPAHANNLAPKINLNVKHGELPIFETKFFFPEFNNLVDQDFLELDQNDRTLLIATRIKQNRDKKNYTVYNFDITIEGKLTYKEF